MFGRRGRARPTGYFARGAAPSARVPAAVPAPAPDSLPGRVRSWLKLALTGAAGILAAVITDLQNRGYDSALFVVARGLVYAAAAIGIMAVPLYVTIGVMMAVGAAVVLYFRPHGLRPAFMTGFGSLAALMTVVPGYSGEAGGVAIEDRDGVPVIEEGNVDVIAMDAPPMRLAAFVSPGASDEGASKESAAPSPGGEYEVAVRLQFPNGLPEPVALSMSKGRLKARLYNPATRKAYDLFRPGGQAIIREDDTLLARAVVTASASEGPILIRVESEGYAIQELERTVKLGQNEVWDIVMAPSTEPLLLQRLKHSYAF